MHVTIFQIIHLGKSYPCASRYTRIVLINPPFPLYPSPSSTKLALNFVMQIILSNLHGSPKILSSGPDMEIALVHPTGDLMRYVISEQKLVAQVLSARF